MLVMIHQSSIHFFLYAPIELIKDICVVKAKDAFEHSTGLYSEQFSAVKKLFTANKVTELARQKHDVSLSSTALLLRNHQSNSLQPWLVMSLPPKLQIFI